MRLTSARKERTATGLPRFSERMSGAYGLDFVAYCMSFGLPPFHLLSPKYQTSASLDTPAGRSLNINDPLCSDYLTICRQFLSVAGDEFYLSPHRFLIRRLVSFLVGELKIFPLWSFY